MGLGTYKNIMRSAPFVKKINELGVELKSENSNALAQLNNNKDSFNQGLLQAQAYEKRLFSLLGITNYSDSEEALKILNKRIQEYQHTIINLNGRGLYRTFILPLEKDGIMDVALFELAAKEVMEKFFNKEYPKTLPDKVKTIGQFIQQTITKEMSTSSQYFHSELGYNLSLNKTGEDFDVLDYVRVFDLTKQQRDRLLEMIREKGKEDKLKGLTKTNARLFVDSEVSNSKIQTWLSFTKGKTETKAKKLTSKTLKEKNRQLKDFIIMNSGVSSDKISLLSMAIDEVLNKNPTALFIGKNEKEVIGILGEIQSLFYLYLLVGPNAAKIIWRGGTHEGEQGKKPHQDIVFEQLGIQIKNSTKDLLKLESDFLVNFKDVKLEEFLTTLNLSEHTRNIFEYYFGMYKFNVPYIVEKGDYKQSKEATNETEAGRNFNRARGIMDTSMQTDVDRLLSLFASVLMYLTVSDIEEQDTNTLFILGGVSAITAAAILQEIKENFLSQEKSSFMVNAYQKLEGQNIVGVLQGIKIKQGKDKNNEEFLTRSENVLNTVFVSARYNFKNLISYYK